MNSSSGLTFEGRESQRSKNERRGLNPTASSSSLNSEYPTQKVDWSEEVLTADEAASRREAFIAPSGPTLFELLSKDEVKEFVNYQQVGTLTPPVTQTVVEHVSDIASSGDDSAAQPAQSMETGVTMNKEAELELVRQQMQQALIDRGIPIVSSIPSSIPTEARVATPEIKLRLLTTDEIGDLANKVRDVKREQMRPQIFNDAVKSHLTDDVDVRDATIRVRKLLKRVLKKSKSVTSSEKEVKDSEVASEEEMTPVSVTGQIDLDGKRSIISSSIPQHPKPKLRKAKSAVERREVVGTPEQEKEKMKIRAEWTPDRIYSSDLEAKVGDEVKGDETMSADQLVNSYRSRNHVNDVSFIQSKVSEISMLMRILKVNPNELSMEEMRWM